MPRRPRRDVAGSWHHVMNRGIARRTLFDHRRDMTEFLDQLGAAVERGEIEVHAYSLMRTHYHLLLRSPEGTLAAAMHRVQLHYSRWFNRGRHRDGPLVRSRYCSRRVESLAYRRAVVSYIDRNAVSAGIARSTVEYPYGSARDYASRRNPDRGWLERAWVEGTVMKSLGLSQYPPHRYREVFGRIPPSLARIVEARLRSRQEPDPLDDLLSATPAGVRAWMKRKARLADGTEPGLPIIAPSSLALSLRTARSAHPEPWRIRRRDGWKLLQIGLSHEHCGSTLERIGSALGVSTSTAARYARLHRSLLVEDASYAERACTVMSHSLAPWRAS